MKYKIISISLLAILLTGCGKSATDNNSTGQVKRVEHTTPIICMNYNDADISLGVMKNGTGSMSTHDMWFYVPKDSDYQKLLEASKNGKLVDFTYDTNRWTMCTENQEITSVTIEN